MAVSALSIVLRPSYLGMLAALLIGCAVAPRSGNVAAQSDLIPLVEQYYQENAVEEGGRCRSVVMSAGLGTRVVAEDEARIVLRVPYVYREFAADSRTTEFNAKGRTICRGKGTRTFTIEKRARGLEVVDMSGAREGLGIRIERVE